MYLLGVTELHFRAEGNLERGKDWRAAMSREKNPVAQLT